MSNEADRMSRAGNYVLGLMNEAERERAERDLERDASFREAVLSVAERMRLIGAPPEATTGADERWRSVAARISALPQMRGAMPPSEETDAHPGLTLPAGPGPAGAGTALGGLQKVWRGPHAVPSTRAAIAAACLIAVFAAGYLAGVASAELSAPHSITAAGPGDTP